MSDREIRTVLLVDGSASILFYLAMLLRRLDYKVVATQSAEEALRIMDESTPTIVLTEIDLPQMGGMQFLRTLSDSLKFKYIPVVILTSKNDPAMKDACTRMGYTAFLSKPVEPDVLYRTLQSVSESVPRAYIRLSTSLKVVIGDASETGGAKRTEYATAISEGGLYIRTVYLKPRNTLMPLSIFFKDRQINVKAVVLYSFSVEERSLQEPGMGMKFVEISDADRALIRSFIKEQLTGDLGTLL